MSEVRMALIVAIANNFCIGENNKLPWHLPADLKHFKEITTGKPVIMGRKTFESIGRPLGNRTNIVVSRNPLWRADGIISAQSVEQAIVLATKAAQERSVDELVCIGGAQIYQEMMDLVDRIYLTRVNITVHGDAYFPPFNNAIWQQISKQEFQPDDKNSMGYTFECWIKKQTK
jgi:dihydrofolate reductase